jgi:uncharacterized membrane protein YhaH (DUF805 family)/antitoxin component YwqK of YwqJK toxin-antitoxin module
MRGTILYYDADKGQGLISGEDEKRYSFTEEEVQNADQIGQGMEVDFISDNGEEATGIYTLSTTAQHATGNVAPEAKAEASGVTTTEYVMGKPGGLFSLKGCYTRKQFWLVTIGVWLVFLGLYAIYIIARIEGVDGVSKFELKLAKIAVFWIAGLLAFWVQFATSVKRFHDINKSGAWWLVNLVPIVGPFAVLVMNGFIGSKRVGNMYAIALDEYGNPIIKGSEAHQRLESLQRSEKPIKASDVPGMEQVKEEKAPRSPAKRKKMLKLVGIPVGSLAVLALLLVFVIPISSVSYYNPVQKIYSQKVEILGMGFETERDKRDRTGYPNKDEWFKSYSREGTFMGHMNGTYTTKSWYKDGQLELERIKENGKTVYERKWHPNRQLKLEQTAYERKEWYSNGQLKYEKIGLRQPTYTVKEWLENGLPYKEESYVNGKKKGTFKKSYADGTPRSVTQYLNGEQHGVFKLWHSSGVLIREYEYINGRKSKTIYQIPKKELRALRRG